jgi:cephalosporin hydroxylase
MNNILHIVTPCTRKQEYLDKCFESIIQLNYNWKWYIVINKNVYKENLDIRKYNNTELLVQEKENKWNSLINHYLDKINEENSLVYFLDDDNLIHPNFNKALKLIVDTNRTAIIFSQEGKYNNNESTFIRQATNDNLIVEKIDQGQIIYSRDSIGDLRYWEDNYRGDGYFIMEYLIRSRQKQNNGKILIFPEICSYYNAQKWKGIAHIYNKIEFGENWFTYESFYKFVLSKFDNATFVEVGSWKGKSSAFLAVEIANSGKDIQFYCIDTWRGSQEHQNMDLNNLYDTFLNNMKPLSKYYKAIRIDSVEASTMFEDYSLDFVFLDADHSYEGILKDLHAWDRKIKPGGIIAGHDYKNTDFIGIEKAVHEFYGENNINKSFQKELVWYIQK